MGKSISAILPLFTLTLILLLSPSQAQPLTSDEIVGKVVEIEPVALDVVIPVYENVIVYFGSNLPNSTSLSLYERAVKQISIPESKRSNTLFAFCDVEKDQAGHIKKYGVSGPGIKFITNVNHYDLPFSSTLSEEEYFFNHLPVFINNRISPPLPTGTKSGLSQFENKYVIAVTTFTQRQLEQTELIYQNSYHFLKLFGVHFYAIPFTGEGDGKKPKIELFYNEELKDAYPSSAIDAFYNFTTEEFSQSQLNDFLDFVNIATIDEVSVLNESNYIRIFGSSLNSQLLLIYRESDRDDEEVGMIRKIFEEAAEFNKAEELSYERVLFAEATTEFLDDYFADSMLEELKTDKFQIIFTKTEYASFQLRKYKFTEKLENFKNLIDFMGKIRRNEVEANYKSEPVPENNQDARVRKIVGYTFLDEVFQQKDKSVMVLFIDSKEKQSYAHLLAQLQKFAQKYHEAYKEKLHVGVFDLAKNEHQLLTIKKAPELVLFERTNKKQPKFFQGQPTEAIIRNFVNYEVKDLTIPDNFGEKILPLGGGEL